MNISDSYFFLNGDYSWNDNQNIYQNIKLHSQNKIFKKPLNSRISTPAVTCGWRTIDASIVDNGSVSAEEEVPSEFSPESLTSSRKINLKLFDFRHLPKFQSIPLSFNKIYQMIAVKGEKIK